jgi:radical SAM superfamily enzyme YgiQ (UPF0313 family)
LLGAERALGFPVIRKGNPVLTLPRKSYLEETMTRKLLLINPVEKGELSLAANIVIRVPPTSLGYLATLTPSYWNIKIIDENIESMTFEDVDLVGITAMTSNAPRAYEISEQYRQKGIKTVIGGVHASMLPEEAARFCDSVVIGEAESVWKNLLHDFEGNELKRFYRGERISSENIVRVRRDLYKSNRYKLGAVETARGCPMDCEFCSVTTLYGRTYRHRPIKEVLDELGAINSKNILFIDDNILGYGEKAEERAIQLFRKMIERGLNKRWVCQVGIDVVNNSEVLKYAKKAGCLAVFIGLESLNEEVLIDMHKVRNLRVGVRNYKEVVKKIHEHGIGISGAFVFGNDRDKKDVFQRTTEFIMDSKIDGAQLSILTPLPGTRLYARLKQEGRLLYTNYPNDWKHYGFTQAVFKPKHMTPGELEDGVTQIYKHTTSRVTSMKRALNSILFARSLYGGVVAYAYNRGYRSFWMKNYDNIRNGLPSRSKDSYLPYAIIDGEIHKTKDLDGSENSSTLAIKIR